MSPFSLYANAAKLAVITSKSNLHFQLQDEISESSSNCVDVNKNMVKVGMYVEVTHFSGLKADSLLLQMSIKMTDRLIRVFNRLACLCQQERQRKAIRSQACLFLIIRIKNELPEKEFKEGRKENKTVSRHIKRDCSTQHDGTLS